MLCQRIKKYKQQGSVLQNGSVHPFEPFCPSAYSVCMPAANQEFSAPEYFLQKHIE
jgi:hypothetical protein